MEMVFAVSGASVVAGLPWAIAEVHPGNVIHSIVKVNTNRMVQT